jgi:thiol-disulfide isomerase/thioredoxin
MTQKLKLALGAAAFVVLIAAAAVGYNALNSRVKLAQELAAEPGSDLVKAPDFSMTDKDGNTVTLSGLIANGKPVVLNFWASWCPPCKVEMPEFDRVYQEFGGEVQFVMLNLADGQRETIEKGGQYVR